jgi:hypothetical protein
MLAMYSTVQGQASEIVSRPSSKDDEEELAEARSRLAAGLKRYFHGKRMEGLLSNRVSPLLMRTSLFNSRFEGARSSTVTADITESLRLQPAGKDGCPVQS